MCRYCTTKNADAVPVSVKTLAGERKIHKICKINVSLNMLRIIVFASHAGMYKINCATKKLKINKMTQNILLYYEKLVIFALIGNDPH